MSLPLSVCLSLSLVLAFMFRYFFCIWFLYEKWNTEKGLARLSGEEEIRRVEGDSERERERASERESSGSQLGRQRTARVRVLHRVSE